LGIILNSGEDIGGGCRGCTPAFRNDFKLRFGIFIYNETNFYFYPLHPVLKNFKLKSDSFSPCIHSSKEFLDPPLELI
jgi:hypothetical protein